MCSRSGPHAVSPSTSSSVFLYPQATKVLHAISTLISIQHGRTTTIRLSPFRRLLLHLLTQQVTGMLFSADGIIYKYKYTPLSIVNGKYVQEQCYLYNLQCRRLVILNHTLISIYSRDFVRPAEVCRDSHSILRLTSARAEIFPRCQFLFTRLFLF